MNGGHCTCRILGQLDGGEGRPGNALFTGFGPKDHHKLAGEGRLGTDYLFYFDYPQAEGVDQGIFIISAVVDSLSAHGGDFHVPPVVRHAVYRFRGQKSGPRVGRFAQEEAVHYCNGPGPQGHNIPDNSPHSRGCAVIGLHRRGVVVALRLEGGAETFAQVNYPCVFTGTQDYGRAL